MLALENENMVYKELWHSWEPKIRTTIRSATCESIVGRSTDDILSLARIVLLKALRSYQSTRAKFNTYFYRCLSNEVRKNYKRSSPIYEAFVVRYKDENGNVQTLNKRFGSPFSAMVKVHELGLKDGQIEHVVLRPKRVPQDRFCSISKKMMECVHDPNVRSFPTSYPWKRINYYIPDPLNQRIILSLYSGESYSCICQKLEISYRELKRRLFSIRRAIIRAAKDGEVLIT